MKKTLIAVLAATLAAGAAHAQVSPPAAGARHGAPFARMCADADARVSARLAYLETKLKLSVDQRAAWDAFARDSRAAAEPLKALCASPPARPADNDPAARLAGRERMAGAMAASLAALRPAVERLQAMLDDGQKRELSRAIEFGGGGPRGRRPHRH
jgi:hypothetical protein